jgi:sugar lactone lactonase YvrE
MIQSSAFRRSLGRPTKNRTGNRVGAAFAVILLAASTLAAHAQGPGLTFAGTAPVNLGSSKVGSAATPVTITYNVTGSGTIGLVAVLTGGAPKLDFTLDPSSTCKGAVTQGNTCTVVVDFTPKYAGQRLGAVQIFDADKNFLVTTNIYGTGTGPQITFQPGTQSTLVSGFTKIFGVAVDASGNVYFTSAPNDFPGLYKILAVNGSIPSNPTADLLVNGFAEGFSEPVGVAVDGAGNVYVADAGNNAIYEILALDGVITESSPTIRTLGSGFVEPLGVAVDASGNVYVVDISGGKGGAVKEMLAVNGRIPDNPTIKILADNGFLGPDGMAVDASGNVYVADTQHNALKEILAVDGTIPSNPTIKVLGSGLNNPNGVAVDASGNVYVADGGDNLVKELLAVNGSIPDNPIILTLGSGFIVPIAVAVAPNGNLYVADFENNRVVELDLADPPSLSFPSTLVGALSPAQAVTVANVGNAALTGSGLEFSDATDFSQIEGPGKPEDCTASFSLAPSAQCDLSIVFGPQSVGPLSGTVTLTDNSGNTPGATQSITLSGTGITNPEVTVTSNLNPWVATTDVTFSVAVVPLTGNSVPTGTVAFTVDGATAATVGLNGGQASFVTAALPAGTHTVVAHYSGDGTHSATVSAPYYQTIYNGPVMTGLSRRYAANGVEITIFGRNFGATQGSSTVTFHNVPVSSYPNHPVTWSDTSITASVPLKATTGNIVVTVGGAASNPLGFTVAPSPVVTDVQPRSGPVRTTITVTGTNLLDLDGNALVSFGSLFGTIVSQSSTSIEVIVPEGATTGPVRVHANGTGYSGPIFTVN